MSDSVAEYVLEIIQDKNNTLWLTLCLNLWLNNILEFKKKISLCANSVAILSLEIIKDKNITLWLTLCLNLWLNKLLEFKKKISLCV